MSPGDSSLKNQQIDGPLVSRWSDVGEGPFPPPLDSLWQVERWQSLPHVPLMNVKWSGHSPSAVDPSEAEVGLSGHACLTKRATFVELCGRAKVLTTRPADIPVCFNLVGIRRVSPCGRQ
jgi:hypothetical protein